MITGGPGTGKTTTVVKLLALLQALQLGQEDRHALPPRARLVLLGDKDQLASVEASAVLGDLCQRAEGGHYTPATAEWLEAVTGAPLPQDYRDEQGQPLDQAIAMLRVSHRFDAASGIGQLAEAVNRPLDAGHTAKEKRPRELVDTGITRARDWLTLVETGRGMLDEAVTREVMRVSGLGRL